MNSGHLKYFARAILWLTVFTLISARAQPVVVATAGSIPTIDSAVALSTRIPSRTTPVIRVQGYYVAGDGGGGDFIYRPTGSGVGARKPYHAAVGGGVWEMAEWDGNVKSMGAKGDGVSDDTAAIQAAIDMLKSSVAWSGLYVPTNNAGRVFVPAGVYRVSSTIQMGNHIVLEGEGPSSMLKLTGTNSNCLLMSSNVVGWTVRNLTLDGNVAEDANANVLWLKGTQYGLLHARVEDITIQNSANHGIVTEIGGAAVFFSNIIIKNCQGVGMYISSGSDCKVDGMDISFCTLAGWWMNFVANWEVNNVKIWACRVANPTTLNTTLLIPISSTLAGDSPTMMVLGAGHHFNNLEIQENASIGIRIGENNATFIGQAHSCVFNNLYVDGNGGYDSSADDTTNGNYRRPGLQFVNYYNIRVNGVFDDFRARQHKGRQSMGFAFLVTQPIFNASLTSLRTDNWYRIIDNSGGAIFTNLMLSLDSTLRNNSVGFVFQAQTDNYATPIPASWGTGQLNGANDRAVVDAMVVNQWDQNHGTGPGYDIATAGPLSDIRVNGLYQRQGFTVATNGFLTLSSDATLRNAAPRFTMIATNGASGGLIDVSGANPNLFRITSGQTNTVFTLQVDGTLALDGNKLTMNNDIGAPFILWRGFNPNGTFSGIPGSITINTNGGTNTTFWVKESGTGNTGWVGYGAGGGGGGGSGTVTSIDFSGGTTGLTTSGGPVTTAGTVTLAGTLDLDNGGTGSTTAAGARTALGLGSASTNGNNAWIGTNTLSTLINAGVPNGAGADVDWSHIKGMPAVFADNSDDGAGGGSGTVTSVGFSAPTSIFNIGLSPVTTSGTISLNLTNQTANTHFLGPASGGAAAPTFRAMVAADIPSSIALTTPTIGDFSNATHAHTGASSGGTLGASAIASGTIATARLGTGTANSSTFLRGDQTWASPTGSGDFVGPGSSTDNAIVVFDGTTGKLGEDSSVIIGSKTNLTVPGTFTADRAAFTDLTVGNMGITNIVGTQTLGANPTLPASGFTFGATGIIGEGSTSNAFEAELNFGDPTADRTITLPDASGTVALTTSLRKHVASFTPLNNQPPATLNATLSTRNSITCLEFDPATAWNARFVFVMPDNVVLTSGLIVNLSWMTTATSGNGKWGVSFMRMNTDLDSDSFDTEATGTDAASGTSGIATITSITNANIDGCVAGEPCMLKVERKSADGADTIDAANLQLFAAEVKTAN